jgi:hypothetical protein
MKTKAQRLLKAAKRRILKSFLGIYLERIMYRIRFRRFKPQFKKSLLSIQGGNILLEQNEKFKNSRVLLPLIETTHYKCVQLLLIAKALELRGAKVLVLICGKTLGACEVRSKKMEYVKNPCWRCKYNEKNLLPLFGLDVVTLSDYLAKPEINNLSTKTQYKGIPESVINDIDRCVEDSVIRHYYGNVPTDEHVVNQMRAKYQHTANLSWKVAQKIHQEFDPTLVLGYMVAYADFVPYLIYFENANIPFKLVSSTQFNGNAQIFHWPEIYHSNYRFKTYLATRSDSRLTEGERRWLADFIAQRKQGLDPVLNNLAIAKDGNIKNLSSHGIEIDNEKRNIFLFSNVHWDVGFSDMNNVYTSIIDWVLSTVKIVSENQECHLYIRCHPAEKLDVVNGSKGIEDFLREEFPDLPENITIISSDNSVSSYELFPYIDLGVVSNGTIGLELLLDKIPVSVVGKAPYSMLIGSSAPKDKDEYKEILFGNAKVTSIRFDEIEMFAYFYFCKTSIPWNLTESSYPANIFAPLQFESLEDLLPGKDHYLDHLCNCLVDSSLSPEVW